MYCTKCGKLNQPTDINCTSCGQPLQNAAISGPAQPVSNYLIPAILTTIFCCLPLGIIAIVYAAQVNSKLQAGDYNGAVNSSRKAKIWSWFSFGIGLLFILLMLAVIAIPQFFVYRERADAIKTKQILRQVCVAKAVFFSDISDPNIKITMNDLMAELATENISMPPDMELTIEDGTYENFTLVAVNKSKGKTYILKDKDLCNIEELPVAK
jgi:hypothetical protein